MTDLSAALNGDTIRVRVRPGARRTVLTRVEAGVAHIDLAAQPEKGRANAELERFLRKVTGRRARIVSGAALRSKIVRLE